MATHTHKGTKKPSRKPVVNVNKEKSKRSITHKGTPKQENWDIQKVAMTLPETWKNIGLAYLARFVSISVPLGFQGLTNLISRAGPGAQYLPILGIAAAAVIYNDPIRKGLSAAYSKLPESLQVSKETAKDAIIPLSIHFGTQAFLGWSFAPAALVASSASAIREIVRQDAASKLEAPKKPAVKPIAVMK